MNRIGLLFELEVVLTTRLRTEPAQSNAGDGHHHGVADC